MANIAPAWTPMFVGVENEDSFVEVKIGSSKTRVLTMLEVIVLAYCRTNTYRNLNKGR